MIGRQLTAENQAAGGIEYSPEELKWRIALRMYAAEPEVVALIEQQLAKIA